jgi:hypothetical protein
MALLCDGSWNKIVFLHCLLQSLKFGFSKFELNPFGGVVLSSSDNFSVMVLCDMGLIGLKQLFVLAVIYCRKLSVHEFGYVGSQFILRFSRSYRLIQHIFLAIYLVLHP